MQFNQDMKSPSIDEWLAQAKEAPEAELCGMYLVHNGVVRATPKAQARENVSGLDAVSSIEFSYDAAGVEEAVVETRAMPGVHYVRVWLNTGTLAVGETLMYVLVGADIRPRCIAALEFLVEKIKSELVVEKEISVSLETSASPDGHATTR